MQQVAILKNGDSAILDYDTIMGGAPDSGLPNKKLRSGYLMVSIEGRPFQPLHKSKIKEKGYSSH